MELTPEQSQALAQGDAIRIVINGTPCVLLRQDCYYPKVIDDEADLSVWYPAVIEVLNQEDESPDQYLEYLDD